MATSFYKYLSLSIARILSYNQIKSVLLTKSRLKATARLSILDVYRSPLFSDAYIDNFAKFKHGIRCAIARLPQFRCFSSFRIRYASLNSRIPNLWAIRVAKNVCWRGGESCNILDRRLYAIISRKKFRGDFFRIYLFPSYDIL